MPGNEQAAVDGVRHRLDSPCVPNPYPVTALRPLTDEEQNLLDWVRAEREWHVEEAQKALWRLEEEHRQAEFKEKCRHNDAIIAEHEALLAGATGLRRAVLQLHGPVRDDPESPICLGCPGGRDYDPLFKCETYVLARDFEETP